ncbi:DsrE family protein [Candidatus Woesearchaeota archaeon]|nr:DsrE family protein [Candidatus Woesearchaeota archaeon]
MNIGMVLNTNDPEEVWNAFRFGVKALGKGHKASAFLFNKGVEAETAGNGKFDIKGMMQNFRENGGVIMACGTCLKLRNKPGTALCPINTLDDLMQLVETADKIISFG